MSKTIYEKATPAINDLVLQVMESYHPQLLDEKLRVATTVVRRFEGADNDEAAPALKHHGAQANAVIRKVTTRRRVLVQHDVELELDGLVWDGLKPDSRVALLDHELNHVVLVTDKSDRPVRDDLGNLKIRLRPDEVTFTGFFAVIARHGKAAIEAQSFERLYPLYLSSLESATRRGAAAVARAVA